MHATTLLLLTLALALHLSRFHVAAHGLVTEIQGANGIKGKGFGVLDDTPRDCTQRDPCQRDTSIIRDREISSGRTGPCGRTIAGGNIDIASELSAAAARLPTAAADGTVSFTIHSVNQDGNGPFSADIDPTGTGNSFQKVQLTQNVRGFLGFSGATATDHPASLTIPSSMTCTGGASGNMCLVRVRNNTPAGPFGSCFAVAQ